MADFPRIKWLNVDGQQVPFTEPQHFTGSGDETVRTGKDNPLPVANYTQDENGIWLPVSKDNPLPTQVTGSKVEYEKVVNAETIESESSLEFDFNNKGERYTILFISIDQQPWSFRTRNLNDALWYSNVFPRIEDNSETYREGFPIMLLPLPNTLPVGLTEENIKFKDIKESNVHSSFLQEVY